MKLQEFEVGQELVVIDNLHYHLFDLGQRVRVLNMSPYTYNCVAIDNKFQRQGMEQFVEAYQLATPTSVKGKRMLKEVGDV